MMEFQEFWKSYKRMCDKHSTCEICPMNRMRFDFNGICVKAIEKNPQQAEQIVEQWAKENQVVTNGDKFQELFGIELKSSERYDGYCLLAGNDGIAKDSEEWLNQEYKEPEEKTNEHL